MLDPHLLFSTPEKAKAHVEKICTIEHAHIKEEEDSDIEDLEFEWTDEKEVPPHVPRMWVLKVEILDRVYWVTETTVDEEYEF